MCLDSPLWAPRRVCSEPLPKFLFDSAMLIQMARRGFSEGMEGALEYVCAKAQRHNNSAFTWENWIISARPGMCPLRQAADPFRPCHPAADPWPLQVSSIRPLH